LESSIFLPEYQTLTFDLLTAESGGRATTAATLRSSTVELSGTVTWNDWSLDDLTVTFI
ncbi:hypothetical protein OGATHE_000292, partial [Ogataea polymorpha]